MLIRRFLGINEDRIYKKLKFEPYNETDIEDILSQITDLSFTPDAIKYLVTRTNQFRKIVQTLDRLEKQAETNSFSKITENIIKGIITNERQSINFMPKIEKMYT